eukprot:12913964-Prorocentrum_lima.AAC.1
MEEQAHGRQAHQRSEAEASEMRQMIFCWSNNWSKEWMPHRGSFMSVKCTRVAECNRPWRTDCWNCKNRLFRDDTQFFG